MGKPLAGRRALITGATGGLGLSMARALAEAGAAVVINGLDEAAQFEPIVRQLRDDTGADVHYLRADLRDLAAIARMMDDAGDVDILVNSAVVRHFAPIDALSPAQWDEGVAVNISAAFHTIRLALPGMRARGYGRVFNMTSVYAERAAADRVGYCVAKAALEALTRSVAVETIGLDISAHALCPGSVSTPGTEARVEELMRAGLSREAAVAKFLHGKQPSGRFIASESVTQMLVLLCGPAGLDMNGAVLPIDGGWRAL